MNEQDSETRNKALVLAELQKYQDALMDAGDSLDSKIHQLIAAGSLVLGLFSTLGMIQTGPVWYWVVVLVLAVAYLVSLIWLGSVLLPANYAVPIQADWANLYTAYVPLQEANLYDRMIKQYILAIEANSKVTERKAKAVRIGVWALMATLVILIGSRLLLAMSSPAPTL